MCAVAGLTPLEAEELTAAEIRTVLDGEDWRRDRLWEIALFMRQSPDEASKIVQARYPSFRRPEGRRKRRRFRMGDNPPEAAEDA